VTAAGLGAFAYRKILFPLDPQLSKTKNISCDKFHKSGELLFTKNKNKTSERRVPPKSCIRSEELDGGDSA
jgi:hypothetical protein